jgi:hypothetical protein
MVKDKRKFALGVGLQAAFLIVLVAFLSPIFGGQNGLDFLDNLYNSISKGSAYYIPNVTEDSAAFQGTSVSVALAMESGEQAGQTVSLFERAGAGAASEDNVVKVGGDLGAILARALGDADAMYHNDGQAVSSAYGYDERRALYNWWYALNEMEKDLKKQGLFREASAVATARKRAVETSYNYYGIEPEEMTSKIGIVILSLIFYVVYTIWYGFGFMYIFEGLGMRLGH